MQENIGFIGGGNMARSLIGGLIASGIKSTAIHVADPNPPTLQRLANDFGVTTHDQNQTLVDTCDVVVFAVKPQVLQEVARQLQLDNSKLIITIAAGINTSSLEQWLTAQQPIVRAMPNTPALVQSGASGLYANTHVSTKQKETAESILRAVGLTVWVENEAQMDAVTALSGSGPAYFFLFIEALENAGTKLGLTAETARLLAIETAFGASKLALEADTEPAQLRQQVTSPGGTTEQAIRVFLENDLPGLVENAMTAAYQRAEQLAVELGKSK